MAILSFDQFLKQAGGTANDVKLATPAPTDASTSTPTGTGASSPAGSLLNPLYQGLGGLKDLYGFGDQSKSIATKLANDVQSGAADMQAGHPIKGAVKAGFRTAGDIAGTVYAPIGAALGATGIGKVFDFIGALSQQGGKYNPLNAITDMKSVQQFVSNHPNLEEDFGRALNLAFAAMDKGQIDPKTVVPRTIAQFQDAATKTSALAQTAIDKTKAAGTYLLGHKDSKLLSIFTGESQSVVDTALKNPQAADLGIQQGDAALRDVVTKGSEASIKAKTDFIKGQSEAVNQIIGNDTAHISRQKVLYQFVDDLEKQNAVVKDGQIDFSTSKINANPGEVSKINAAYTAIQNWSDWSVSGVHQLKQLVGEYTKFPSEAGGTSKSPFLGRFYNYLNNTVQDTLPPEKAAAYAEANTKFSNTIDLYDEMVNAFNSGDPFTRIAQLFSSNKDSLRQVVDFYEKTTGNPVAPVVAGRTLAESKPAAFGFLNPRQWVDFFIDPKTQASIVTRYGKWTGGSSGGGMSAENAANTPPISNGIPTASANTTSNIIGSSIPQTPSITIGGRTWTLQDIHNSPPGFINSLPLYVQKALAEFDKVNSRSLIPTKSTGGAKNLLK